MRASRAALAASLLVLVIPLAAHAGKPHERTGFFIGFGLGAGSASWDWQVEDWGSADEWSGSGNFRIGGAVQPDLVLHLEATSWVKGWDVVSADGQRLGDADLTLGVATFAVTYFPKNMGLLLRAGVGIATADAKVPVGTAPPFDIFAESTDTGFGMLAAVGYEWRLTNKFAMGPQIELVYLGIDGDFVKNAFVVDGGLEFNWYW